jgi:lysozyme family protein
MPDVRQIAREIIAREGGFVDDPDDPGGATKHGVTLHTLRRLGLDLDGDADIDRADVEQISLALAEEIFVTEYFDRPGIARLPEPLHSTVFDMQVNAGANAVKILQRLVSAMGFPCAADGVIGPQTLAAVQAAFSAAADFLADAYGIERRNYYFVLADQRASARKYVVTRKGGKGGWITRAEAFIAPKYHLTPAQFKARIAAWH